jgi:hypothetical protein
MPPKKTTTKKKAEEPQPTLVDGFTTVDYEGHEMFVCDRCGFDTFSTEAAPLHLATHGRLENAEKERADLTEHLTETSQVTQEEPDGQS